MKKYRAEISHMKQIENELRQKLDANLTSKSTLQAKQKECDELEKRIQELNNARHSDMLNLQTVERRLNEERRQKQSLDSQLANEKKARKAAEEKAARPECSAQCKQRRQQMDEELKRLRAELKQSEESKQLAVEHGRKLEQEVCLPIFKRLKFLYKSNFLTIFSIACSRLNCEILNPPSPIRSC